MGRTNANGSPAFDVEELKFSQHRPGRTDSERRTWWLTPSLEGTELQLQTVTAQDVHAFIHNAGNRVAIVPSKNCICSGMFWVSNAANNA